MQPSQLQVNLKTSVNKIKQGRLTVASVFSVLLVFLFDAGDAVDVLDLLRAVLDLSGDFVMDFQNGLTKKDGNSDIWILVNGVK